MRYGLTALGFSVLVSSLASISCKPGPDRAVALAARQVGEAAQSAAFDTIELDAPSAAESFADGTLSIATLSNSRLAVRIGHDGEVLNSFGRLGEGPGEYRRVIAVMLKGDSLLLLNERGVFLLYGPDGTFLRTVPPMIAAWVRGFYLRGDTLLLAGSLNTQASFGFPVHLFAPSGQLARSLGAENRSFVGRAELVLVARATDSSFWLGHHDSYKLELWDTKGARERILDIPDSSLSANPPSEAGGKRFGRIQDIYLDSTKRIYVLIHQTDSVRIQRKPSPGSIQRPAKESSIAAPLYERAQSTHQHVEIRSSIDGRLLRTVPLADAYFLRFLRDGRLFGVGEGRDGSSKPVVRSVGPQ